MAAVCRGLKQALHARAPGLLPLAARTPTPFAPCPAPTRDDVVAGRDVGGREGRSLVIVNSLVACRRHQQPPRGGSNSINRCSSQHRVCAGQPLSKSVLSDGRTALPATSAASPWPEILALTPACLPALALCCPCQVPTPNCPALSPACLQAQRPLSPARHRRQTPPWPPCCTAGTKAVQSRLYSKARKGVDGKRAGCRLHASQARCQTP